MFGTIFAFGLVCLATGIFQIRTGRRNLAFVVLMLLLAGVIDLGQFTLRRAEHIEREIEKCWATMRGQR